MVKNGQVVDLPTKRGAMERGRRHQQLVVVQERPLLPHQPRLWRVHQPPRAGLAGSGLGGPKERGAVERVQWGVPGESLECSLIFGPTPKEVFSRYTALTGRPALPPPSSFGLWLTPGARQALVHHRLRRGHGAPNRPPGIDQRVQAAPGPARRAHHPPRLRPRPSPPSRLGA